MLRHLLIVVGLGSFSMQSFAAYRCELFDRAENAPGGNIPAKTLFSDTSDFNIANPACRSKVDRLNFIDYWLKWMPTSELPVNWLESNLLAETPEQSHKFVDQCAGTISGSSLPPSSDDANRGISGGELDITGYYSAETTDLKKLNALSLHLLIPGYENEEHEYMHSVSFAVSKAKITKISKTDHLGNSIAVINFESGSVMSTTVEGDTETVNLQQISLISEPVDDAIVELTFQPQGGVSRSVRYVLIGQGCLMNWL